MDSRAKLLGHPIHQMLIVFPLGLLTTAVAFDVVYLFTRQLHWADVAYWLIFAGIVGGLLAAVFGLMDWLAIPAGTRAKRVGLLHAGSNVLALVLFLISCLLRWRNMEGPGAGTVSAAGPSAAALVLSFAGLALASLGGWLGGELVDRLGVGVDEGANLNAPNSLSGRPASAS